jgi:hypothetical protein
LKKHIKITKNAHEKGIMDISASLYHYEEYKNEVIYKGKIIISITDYEREHVKGYLDKDIAKVLFHSIINHTFPKIYGKNGFKIDGGTQNGNQCIARTTKVELTKINDEVGYLFTTEYSDGYRSKTGEILPVENAKRTMAVHFVNFLNTLRIAHETYDYIKAEEIKGLINDKPLHTVVYKKEETDSSNVVKEENTEVTAETKNSAEQEDYVIPYGRMKGKKVSSLSSEHLEFIIKQETEDPIAKEFQKYAQFELNKRKQA